MKHMHEMLSEKFVENETAVPADFGQFADQICENALADAKSQLHPLLRNAGFAYLDRRGEFLQAFKNALEQRVARALATCHPGVQTVFQFDESRTTNAEYWDGSIHLLVKVPRLSNAIKTLGRMLDRRLVRYLTQSGWQRVRGHGTILEVQQVTLNELRHAIGYGAMFCAVYTAPVQIWPRERRAKS
jgi:hypothetical protein